MDYEIRFPGILRVFFSVGQIVDVSCHVCNVSYPASATLDDSHQQEVGDGVRNNDDDDELFY